MMSKADIPRSIQPGMCDWFGIVDGETQYCTADGNMYQECSYENCPYLKEDAEP